jgi:hypothetical protein
MSRLVQVSLDDMDLARLLYIAGRLNLTNSGKRGARSALGINVSDTVREALRLTEEMLQITEDGDAMIVLDEVKTPQRWTFRAPLTQEMKDDIVIPSDTAKKQYLKQLEEAEDE